MKKNIIGLGLLIFIAVCALLFTSKSATAIIADGWQDSGPCIQLNCGNPAGEKEQTKTTRTCENSCPVIHFEWRVYSDCPNGYSVKDHDESKCVKDHHPNKGNVINRQYTGKSADVAYNKSQDPNKCHRPSDDTLRDVYGMDRDARNDFKHDNSEWKNSIENCTTTTETRKVACVVPTEEVQECEISPTPTPTGTEEQPTPNPTQVVGNPTATPIPGAGKVAALEYAVSCEKDEVKVEMHFTNDGKAMEGVLAKFDYNGKTREATSNSDGWAITIYGKDGENKVTGYADGFNKIEKTVEFPDCPATGGAVLGTSTARPGQVLGATSYAKTGIMADTVMQLAGVLGTLMVSAGALMHAKQK